ncbi:MAG: lytic transglycosylase domain-containing protein [Caulobacteraceae bacterium]|nr:lytic transglycosylase domain-containing protein [Caulobacteraceae bacterium]
MGALRSVLLAVAAASAAGAALADPSSAPAPALAAPLGVARWSAFIAEAAQRFGIPPAWIAAVMRAESAGLMELNGHPITSRAGAMGLMQVMPQTYAAMRAQHQLGPDPYDPHDNILAGAAYLRAMYERFGYPGLFAAYNAGPARYGASLDLGTPLPGETRAYIASLGQARATPAMPSAMRSGQRLFVALGTNSSLFAAPSGAASDGSEDAPRAPPKAPPAAPSSPELGGLFITLNAASGPGR